VTEDWTAVANAINSRSAELELKQKELSERSGVSLAIALDWHPQYLSAVLNRSTPPVLDAPVSRRDDPVVALLETVVKEIRGLRAQIGTLTKRIDGHTSQDRANEPDTR
jgi:hypothetical protein